MASAAGKSAQKTKLKAEIEYQKSVIAGYQKEFGIAVFPAMKTQDTGKKANDKITKVEAEIQHKLSQIDALSQ